MGAFAGPDIAETGLVLALDAADRNCYSHNYHPKPIDIYGWVSGANGATLSRDTIPSPVGNTPLKMVVTGNDPYTGSYNNSFYNIASAAQGQTWTFSVWAKASTATTGELYLFEANSSGGYTNFSAPGISITTEWQRFSVTRTLTNATTAYVQVRVDGPNSGGTGVTVWWDGMQVERSSSVSRFTSVYTGEVGTDLIGRGNNGTLTNGVSYSDSNSGSFVFDGVDDYISISDSATLKPTSSISVSVWVKFTSAVNSEREMIAEKHTSPNQGWWFAVQSNKVVWLVTTNSTSKYIDMTNNTTINANSVYNIVGTYDGSTGNIKVYVNGIDDGGTVVGSGTGLVNSSNPLYIGSAINWSPNYSANTIYSLQIHNRALTAQEISQNFNMLRGRFGI